MNRFIATFFFMCLFASADAVVRVQRVIGFEEDKSVLSAEALDAIRSLSTVAEGYFVEKVDITSLCEPGEVTYHELQLSKERSLKVYEELVTYFPDPGNGTYEMRYSPATVHPDEHPPSDCVIVTVYLVKEEAPELEFPTQELFPEEFPDFEPPTSMAAAHPAISGRKKKKDEAGARRFTLNNVYFEGNSALYKEESEPTLEEVTMYLKQHPQLNIRLEGHVNGKMGWFYLRRAGKTNPERKAYKNAKHLSLARAESIREYLVDHGVDPARIECVGKGGSERIYKKPRNRKENEANRRIEIILFE